MTKYDFLQLAVGQEGYQALQKSVERFPQLADVILPRVCISWLEVARRVGYEGPVPGTEALVKSGYLHAEGVSESIEDAVPAASLLLVAVGGEATPLPEEFTPKLVAKLAKSIDLLTQRTFLHALRDLQAAMKSSEGTSEESSSAEEPLEKGIAMPGKAAAPREPQAPTPPNGQTKQAAVPPKQ